MTGCPKHIEVRVNPHYKYDEVLKTINDNFYCLNNQISGLTSGNTYISNGINTFVLIESGLTSINVTGVSIDNIYVSGASIFNIISASTIYSNNIVSTGDTIDGGNY